MKDLPVIRFEAIDAHRVQFVVEVGKHSYQLTCWLDEIGSTPIYRFFEEMAELMKKAETATMLGYVADRPEPQLHTSSVTITKDKP